jgi:hypothetical protein
MNTMTVGNDLVVLSAVFAGASPILYAILPNSRKTWWRDIMGKHLMSYMAVIGLVLVESAIAVLFHVTRRDDWFAELRLITFCLVPVVLAWRMIIIVVFGLRGSDEEVPSSDMDMDSRTPEVYPGSTGGGGTSSSERY